MAHTFQVTVDCTDPHELADWWADALGWQREPSDEAFIERMLAAGYAQPSDTTRHRGELVWAEGAAIVHPGGGMPRMLFQRVPEPKTVKNRVHLDVRVGAEAVEAEVARLVAAGARELHRASQGPHSWVTLADPEGNELCLS
ncbi:VOC family protein [Klenkia sp. LSe6-5]|uniref:VOC family protein n=1 Tax=Klenkia sesuvii TaxID=3103137 RepID=A0ABU8DVK6_9ACTN